MIVTKSKGNLACVWLQNGTKYANSSLNLALTLGCLNPKNLNTNSNPDPNSNFGMNLIKTQQSAEI